MSEFPELRAALVAAAARQAEQARATRRAGVLRGRRWFAVWGWRPTGFGAGILAVLGSLSVTAVALAAAGVLSLGGSARFGFSVQPRAGSGVAIPGSVRLLAPRAADPGGGPPWGMRTTRTTRGAVCLTVGRAVDGRLGALGVDGAFSDDGLLHPFSMGLFDPNLCTVPDEAGHVYFSQAALGLPANATDAGLVAGAVGCFSAIGPRGQRSSCPSAQLRDVYYGLLGPDVQSITYRTVSGSLRTEPTTGPDGAYLLILPYRGGPRGETLTGQLNSGPIVKVGVRGGRVCRPRLTGECDLIGERAARGPKVTAADVRAPVHAQVIHARAYCQSASGELFVACAHRVPRGFTRIAHLHPGVVLLNVRTVARRAVLTPASDYVLNVIYSHSPTCFSDGGGSPLDHDVRAGQKLLMQALLESSCPGPVHGSVYYMMPSGRTGPNVSPTRLTVGRYAIDPDRRRRMSAPAPPPRTR